LPIGVRLGCLVVLVFAPLLGGCSHDYAALEGGTGGTVGGGGSVGTGGTVGGGGSVGTGGTVGGGGSGGTGGTVGAGGSVGTGGTVGRGGSVGTGGTVGAGGAVGSGGSVGAGGATGTGGSGPPANNQIVNGDFNSGTSDPWHVTSGGSPASQATSAVTNGQFCVSVPTTYYSFTIGWPASTSPVAVLQPSTRYELYYQISTTAALFSFSAKVGAAPGNATNQTDFMTSGTVGGPTAGAGLQTFAFTFVPGSDPAAGIAFNIVSMNPTTVCIDNVALGTPN
jgi:hypothetical protein